jgi:hypothetical protein
MSLIRLAMEAVGLPGRPSYQVTAVLCDVGAGLPVKSKDRQLIDALLKDGLLELSKEINSDRLILTPRAQQLLAERGVGINEA